MPNELTLKHPMLRDLQGYWRRRQTEGKPLSGVDLDPADLRPWVANLLVMDVIEGDNFIYSYYGKSFERAFGENLAGQSIELLPESQRAVLQAEYETVRTSNAPFSRIYSATFKNGQEESWERLVLPLVGRDGKVSKLIVAAYRLG